MVWTYWCELLILLSLRVTGLICENHCSSNCAGGTCVTNRDGRPECSDGCLPGWTGSTCNVSCEPGCKMCSHHDGNCTDRFRKPRSGESVSCKPGFYGSNCSENCPPNCNPHLCNKKTGYCNNACNNGYYGKLCSRECSGGCINKTCTTVTGICLRGCMQTRYGKRCTKDCSKFCENQVCHQFNGSCIGCTSTRYGVNCTSSCSDRCKNMRCKEEKDGLQCTDGCTDTYRGRYCKQQCPPNCRRCGQFDGNCTACNNGYTGDNCSENVTMKSLIIGISAVLFIAIIVLIVCGILACKYPSQFNRFRNWFARLCSRNQNSSSSDQESIPMTDTTPTTPRDDPPETNEKAQEEEKTLLTDPDKEVTNGESSSHQERSVQAEGMDRNQQHEEGQEESTPVEECQITSSVTIARTVKPTCSSIYIGLSDELLKSLMQILDEYDKSEEGKNSMNTFWIHLGYSEENIPLALGGQTYYSMLKTSPNLQCLDAKHAIYKIIIALRFADMFELAEQLVNKHKDCLPRQFVDECMKVDRMKHRDLENVSVDTEKCAVC